MSIDTLDHNKESNSQYPSRSSRNARLYREIYGKYEDLDNLPIEDNTDEIDLERLREIIYNDEKTREYKDLKEDLEFLDTRKRNIDTERVYDINKMLEKAKYENNKLKEPIVNTLKHNNLLSTLQMKTISDEIIIKKEEDITIEENTDSDNIYMTREFKFKELNEKIEELNNNNNPLIDNVMEDNELSLDLFEDLKPTGDTIVTKPIVDNENKEIKADIHSNDTSDIDVIKDGPTFPKFEKEEDFFTNSYNFSNKDFNNQEQDTDDFFIEKKNSGNALKIILLLIAILVFTFVIVYFILTYGIGV